MTSNEASSSASRGQAGGVGAKGDKGDNGENGDPGSTGSTGSKGATGAKGSAGTNGTNGVNGAAGSGVVLITNVRLTAAQIATSNTNPTILVSAPGSGKIISIDHVIAKRLDGLTAWNFPGSYDITWGPDGSLFGPFDPGDNPLAFVSDGGPYTYANGSVPSANSYESALIENKALYAFSNMDPNLTGPIVTSSVASGGTGYAIGNTGNLNFGGAQYVVDSVNGSGAVLTYHLTNTGLPTGYNTTNNPVATTATSGSGTGFTLNVLSIPPADGEIDLTIFYTIN